MVSSNAEFFQLVDELVKGLEGQGQSELAKRLQTAKSCSTIPGELFGEIELALREIDRQLPDQFLVKKLLNALKFSSNQR